jgi:hypothetical protein
MSHKDTTGDAPPETELLQEDIERTREDLAETIDELTARLDVKARARDKVAEAKERAVIQLHLLRERALDGQGRPRPPVIAVGAGLLAAALTVALVRRRGGRTAGRGRR